MKFSEKDISIIKGVSQIAGGFTIIIAVIMIFSLVQLKSVDPLDNPALSSVREQFDNNQENGDKAAQLRAMDLMARKAYFTSRRQVETGSYLLLAGAIIFVFCQRLIAGNEKVMPVIPGAKPDLSADRNKYRKYLFGSAAIITVAAVAASFMLRRSLPDINYRAPEKKAVTARVALPDNYKPGEINFPFFRGEDSRGIAGGSGFPTEWNYETGMNIKWKAALRGNGKSSPVIWGDRLFVTAAEGLLCKVYCFNKRSGKLLWTVTVSGIPGEPSVLPKMAEDAGLAVSSVAACSKAVCAVFANGNLISLDHDGRKLWAVNLGVPSSSYGYSSSLLIFENTLIVQYDSDKKISLMGFDIETGKLKWETIRSGRPVWSSPVLAHFGNVKQVVLNGNPATAGFDAATGKLLWSLDCLSGDVAPSVAVNSTMVYSVTDYAKLTAILPGTSPSEKWEDNTYTPDVSSPVATDEFLFVATGYGDVACYDAQKGDTLWTHYFMDPFYASPIIADNKVWFLDRTGKMHIVKKSEKFELVSESSIGEPSDCTPAFSEGRIYLRGKENLFCISEN
ncbi:MAG: PQQ-binding-like beta-propeller repeat protein [Bacteroidales bacterium]